MMPSNRFKRQFRSPVCFFSCMQLFDSSMRNTYMLGWIIHPIRGRGEKFEMEITCHMFVSVRFHNNSKG